MKRIFFTLLIALVAMKGAAQAPIDAVVTDSDTAQASALIPQVIIGCLSYDEALRSMPQYATVEEEMKQLQQAFQTEMKRVEDDFNQKYEAFLEGRKDFPRTILLKRQTELQQLLQQNVEFKEKSLAEMAQARKDKLSPLHGLLSAAIADVAREQHLAIVVNTDANACPFIDPSMVKDISIEVKLLLNKTE